MRCKCGNAVLQPLRPSGALSPLFSHSLECEEDIGPLLSSVYGLSGPPSDPVRHWITQCVLPTDRKRFVLVDSTFRSEFPLFVESRSISQSPPLPSCSLTEVFCRLCCSSTGVLLSMGAQSSTSIAIISDRPGTHAGEEVSEAFGIVVPSVSSEALPGPAVLDPSVEARLDMYKERVLKERDDAIRACLALEYSRAEERLARAQLDASCLQAAFTATLQSSDHLPVLVEESDDDDDASSVSSSDSSTSTTSSSSSSDGDGPLHSHSDESITTSVEFVGRLTAPPLLSIAPLPNSPEVFGSWWDVGVLDAVDTPGMHDWATVDIVSAGRQAVDDCEVYVKDTAAQSVPLGTSMPIPIPGRLANASKQSASMQSGSSASIEPRTARLTLASYYNDTRDIAASLQANELDRLEAMGFPH